MFSPTLRESQVSCVSDARLPRSLTDGSIPLGRFPTARSGLRMAPIPTEKHLPAVHTYQLRYEIKILLAWPNRELRSSRDDAKIASRSHNRRLNITDDTAPHGDCLP